MKDIESIKKLAAEIAADLFTSGIGGKVERLALTNDVGDLVRDHGGWCEDAVRDRITVKLTMYAPAPAPEAATFNKALAVETIARLKAERDEARETVGRLREVLEDGGLSGDGGETKHKFSDTIRQIARQLIDSNCEDWADWLQGKADAIDAALAAAPGVPASGGEGGQS